MSRLGRSQPFRPHIAPPPVIPHTAVVTLSDAVTTSESLSLNAAARSRAILGATITPSDSLSGQRAVVRVITDAVSSIADALGRAAIGVNRSSTDSVTYTESLGRAAAGLIRTLAGDISSLLEGLSGIRTSTPAVTVVNKYNTGTTVNTTSLAQTFTNQVSPGNALLVVVLHQNSAAPTQSPTLTGGDDIFDTRLLGWSGNTTAGRWIAAWLCTSSDGTSTGVSISGLSGGNTRIITYELHASGNLALDGIPAILSQTSLSTGAMTLTYGDTTAGTQSFEITVLCGGVGLSTNHYAVSSSTPAVVVDYAGGGGGLDAFVATARNATYSTPGTITVTKTQSLADIGCMLILRVAQATYTVSLGDALSTLSDALARTALGLARPLPSETVTPADGIDRAAGAYTRTWDGDTIALTEQVDRQALSLSRVQPAETMTPAEGLDRTPASYTRMQAAETALGSDQLGRAGMSMARAVLPETVTPSDNLTRALSFARSLVAESLAGLADALGIRVTRNRSSLDTITPADALARAGGTAMRPLIAEAMTLSDALVLGPGARARAVTPESVTPADALARAAGSYPRVLQADSITPGDTLFGQRALNRLAQDTLAGIADALGLTGSTRSRQLTAESVTPADQLGRTGGAHGRAAADATTPADQLDLTASGRARTTADSITHTEQLGRAGGLYGRGLPAESLTPTDALIRVRVAARIIADAVAALIDGLSLNPTMRSRGAGDGMPLSESLGRAPLALNRTHLDAVTPADALVRAPLDALRALTDGIVISEHLTRAPLAAARALLGTPAGMLTDELGRAALLLARALPPDAAGVSDQLAQNRFLHRALADPAGTLADALGRAGSVFTRTQAEAIAQTDQLRRGAGLYVRAGTDTISLSESLTAHRSMFRALADAVSIVEHLARAPLTALRLLPPEPVTPTDSLSRQKVLSRGMSEAINTLVDALRALTESSPAQLSVSLGQETTLTIELGQETTLTVELGQETGDTLSLM